VCRWIENPSASAEASILGFVGISKQMGEWEEDMGMIESAKRNTI